MSKLTRERIEAIGAIILEDRDENGTVVDCEYLPNDEVENHKYLARIGLCFDGVSAEDAEFVEREIWNQVNAASHPDWVSVRRVENALVALVELLRESEKGGGT